MAAIRAEDLWFTYKPQGFGGRKLEPALRGVSFEVAEGEVYGLLGPNGAGKTTLIRLVSTLLLQDKGTLDVLGHRLPRGEEEVRAALGLALAEYERTFHLRLTGRQNLRFHASFLELAARDVPGRIEEVLASVDLASVADKMVIEYSSGMRHRLAVARALLGRPRLLVLDEPTAGLDVASSRALGDLVLRLAREERATVLYTTHRLEEAGRLCDRIGILRKGVLVAQESPDALRKLAGATRIVALKLDRVDETLTRDAETVPGVRHAFLDGTQVLRCHVEDVEAAVEPLLALARKAGRRVLGVRTEEPSVEDAFLAVTAEEGAHAAR